MNKHDDTTRAISLFYDQESGHYDEGYGSNMCHLEDEVLMKYLRPLIQGRVLDVGCGTGLPLQYVDIPNYWGIDISAGMITVASAKYPDKHFIVGDMHNIPFKSEVFDTIISLYGVMSYSLDPRRLISELNRILKPGGVLAIMPYTKRVEHNICLGSYSTAINPDIPKIYYTTKMLNKLFNNWDFESVDIIGINYFTNFFAEMMLALRHYPSTTLCKKIISVEHNFARDLPIEYARHAIVIAQKPKLTENHHE